MILITKPIEWIIMFLTITAQTELDYGIHCFDYEEDWEIYACWIYDTEYYEHILLANEMRCQMQYCNNRLFGLNTIDDFYTFDINLTEEDVSYIFNDD